MDKKQERIIFTKITNYTPKNERISWNRKYKKIKNIINEKMIPLEEKMLELHMQKQIIMDEIDVIRDELIKECVHPRDCLVIKNDLVLCKFCDAKIRVNSNV